MTQRASGIWVLVLRGKRINLLLIREGSGRLLFHEDFKDGATTIKVKVESGLLARRADDMLSLPSAWVHEM